VFYYFFDNYTNIDNTYAYNYQYQIRDNVVTRCGASTGGINIAWLSIVKEVNSNGFDMGGDGPNIGGAYSNF
jgi:hypothetical protein